MRYGVLCAPVVRWLLDQEKDVRMHIRDFLDDKKTDWVDVVLPPVNSSLVTVARKMCPVVRLHLAKVTHHLTGAPGVRVTCTDKDFDVLFKVWQQQQIKGMH